MSTENIAEQQDSTPELIDAAIEKLDYVPPVLERHQGWVDVIGLSI